MRHTGLCSKCQHAVKDHDEYVGFDGDSDLFCDDFCLIEGCECEAFVAEIEFHQMVTV